jgi:glutathione synthase
MKLGFAITRAASVDATWTTLHLARAALARGWPVRFVEPWDFEVDRRRQLIARAHAFDPGPALPLEEMADQLVHRTAVRRFVDVEALDLLLLRAAPLDDAILAFATVARDRGVAVVNDPAGLLAVSHKAWLASLAGAPVPPAVVTRSRASAQLFFAEQDVGVVVKPGRGSGGRGVSRVPPRNAEALDDAVEEATRAGDGYVVVQRYLPEADSGEKRLVCVDGEVLGGYLRQRAVGEFRHNLKRGATAEATEITDGDRAIAAAIAPALGRIGVRFAGLDVIGDWLIEVNALNPGGAFHADRLGGTKIADAVLDRLCERPAGHHERGRGATLGRIDE